MNDSYDSQQMVDISCNERFSENSNNVISSNTNCKSIFQSDISENVNDGLAKPVIGMEEGVNQIDNDDNRLGDNVVKMSKTDKKPSKAHKLKNRRCS